MGDALEGAGAENQVLGRRRGVVNPRISGGAELLWRAVAEAPDIPGGMGSDVLANGSQCPWLQRVRDVAREGTSRGALRGNGNEHRGGVGEGGWDEGLWQKGPPQARMEDDSALDGNWQLRRDVEGRLDLLRPPPQAPISAVGALQGALEGNVELVIFLEKGQPLICRIVSVRRSRPGRRVAAGDQRDGGANRAGHRIGRRALDRPLGNASQGLRDGI